MFHARSTGCKNVALMENKCLLRPNTSWINWEFSLHKKQLVIGFQGNVKRRLSCFGFDSTALTFNTALPCLSRRFLVWTSTPGGQLLIAEELHIENSYWSQVIHQERVRRNQRVLKRVQASCPVSFAGVFILIKTLYVISFPS